MSVLKFYAKRRFNYLDLIVLFAVVETWQSGHYWSALGVFAVGALVSIWAERKAGV